MDRVPLFFTVPLPSDEALASMAVMAPKRGTTGRGTTVPGASASRVPPGDSGLTAEQLTRMASGNAEARNELFRRLYSHLHRIASRVRRKNSKSGLQTTDLIGESYERLVDAPEGGWQDRAHFLARAAIAMRQVLIDHLRAQSAQKRGGRRVRASDTELDRMVARLEDRTGGLLRFDGALSCLRREYPRSAQVVDLRVFAELPVKDVALVLDRSVRSVEREWTFAKAWLKAALE